MLIKPLHMLTCLLAFHCTLCMVAGPALAVNPDSYMGDAAIYTGDNNPNRPNPNVLIVVDNSRTTLNPSSGEKFEPATVYPYAGYNSWDIYAGDNQGTFSKVEVSNPSNALANLTCSVALVRDTLLSVGTYSGAGSEAYPNLNGGACSTGPKGETYALGNYLNYTNKSSATPLDIYVTHNYTYMKKISGKMTAVTEPRSFKLLKTHTAVAGLGNEPNINNTTTGATPWTEFWAVQAAVVSGSLPWVAGTTYTLPASAVVGDTQRKIISDALELVVTGARYKVNFGLMTYGDNNSGGKLLIDVGSLATDAALSAFKAAIPGPGELDGEPVLSSQTNRPQAESVFDAGYYYGAPYASVTNTNRIPTAMINECGYNHIILLTNGLSNGDGSPKLAVIGDADGDNYPSTIDFPATPDESVYGAGSHYLDDIAYYLQNTMGVTTHTILAFQGADALVEKAAAEGHGKFYNAYDANELAKALTDLLTTIVAEEDTSFVAPVVPASSTNRTISSNRVYLGLFKPQNNAPWIGNLKKYGVSTGLALLDSNGNPATDANGDFIPNSKSFWGRNDPNDLTSPIMSMDGLLPLANSSVVGDGGNVSAGGAGGTLKVSLGAAIAANISTDNARKVYTKPPGSTYNELTHSANAFTTSNALITAALLDVDAAKKDPLVNFVRGFDGYDDDKDLNTYEVRDWPMGDILHSKPLVFNYSSFTEAQEGNCSYNKSMVFVGSNDGMFHAFRDCDGGEEWAFIPDNVLPMLKHLRDDKHTAFVDGSVTAYVYDFNDNNIIETASGDKVVLIFGQRRGGGRSTLDATAPRGAYYAIDVSNPLAPVLLWKIDSTTAGFGELGETWTAPRLSRVRIGSEIKIAMFVGAGYDNNEDRRYGNTQLFPALTDTTDTTTSTSDGGNFTSAAIGAQTNPRGRGLYAIEVARLDGTPGNFVPNFTNSGNKLWSYVHADHAEVTFSFPTDLSLMDINVDGFADRIYAGDTGGRMWRFDVGSNDTNNWTGRIIFKANGNLEATQGRKLFYRPSTVVYGNQVLLHFGSGDREHPINSATTDRMYMVRDKGQGTIEVPAVDYTALKDLTANRLQATDATATEIEEILAELRSDTNYGWYVTLERPGEKVLASPLVFNGQVLYTTYTPSSLAALGPCDVGNLGTSRLYHMDYLTAEAVVNYNALNDIASNYATNLRAKGDNDVVLQKIDREMTLGVGIPSGIVSLIDASGKVVLMISSSNRIGTYGSTDTRMITPLYWLQW